MKLNCAIIDDEPLAAEMLAGYAKKTPFLNLIGVYNSAIDAMSAMRTNPVQLLFLDIHMPELSGLELATILPPETMIVFTTAFDRYAVESYKVNTIDYLLKPITYDAFFKAADKALCRYTALLSGQSPTDDRFLYVKSEYKYVRIALDDILYIEGLKDYVRIVLASEEKPVMCLMSMQNIESHLPSPEFLRVHRSFIGHMSKAKTIDHMRITFDSQLSSIDSQPSTLNSRLSIPISDTYKEAVYAYINSHTVS